MQFGSKLFGHMIRVYRVTKMGHFNPLVRQNGHEKLTARVVGFTWEVKSCLKGPPVRNSLLGVICQNPTGGSKLIHPWTRLSLSSQEYWYLSSTCTSGNNSTSKSICIAINHKLHHFSLAILFVHSLLLVAYK